MLVREVRCKACMSKKGQAELQTGPLFRSELLWSKLLSEFVRIYCKQKRDWSKEVVGIKKRK